MKSTGFHEQAQADNLLISAGKYTNLPPYHQQQRLYICLVGSGKNG